MDASLEKAVRQWLEFAAEDLAAARVYSGANVAPNIVCFHAQQAAEKALKAIIVSNGVDPERTHDLNRLCRVPPQSASLQDRWPRFGWLSTWAVWSRYPGGCPEATPEDAREASVIAAEVVEYVRQELARKGIG